MVFSTFILRYFESKFTLLTYLMKNNTVITVMSYCTKALSNGPCNHFKRETFQVWYAEEIGKKDKRWAKHQWHCNWDGHSSYAWAFFTLVDRFLSINAAKNPAIIDNIWKKSCTTDALANGVPSDDPCICTNLMNWIAVHLTFFFVLYTLLCLRNRLPHFV